MFLCLYQLPQRSVDIIAIKQQLLSQYNVLQSRIGDLKLAAEKEVCIHIVLTIGHCIMK